MEASSNAYFFTNLDGNLKIRRAMTEGTKQIVFEWYMQRPIAAAD